MSEKKGNTEDDWNTLEELHELIRAEALEKLVKIKGSILLEMQYDSNHKGWDMVHQFVNNGGHTVTTYEYLVDTELYAFNDPTRGIRKNRLGFYCNCAAMDKKPER